MSEPDDPTWAAKTAPSPSSAGRSTAAFDAQPSADVTPEAPGRYHERTEVGRGGLGQVLLTFDSHLARDVARKELQPSELGSESGPEQLARFLREARVTAQLEHPNIIPVYELGARADGRLYYTMKLVRGRTLGQALREALDPQDRLQLLPHFVDLGQAIAYAHSRGVIHRDIKPENVMIGEFGETVVLDWGVAKVRGEQDPRHRDLARAIARMRDEDHAKTLPGSAFGTPAYMSPEQARGAIERIDERSDVWSLGVVLYKLLSGRLPYREGRLMQLLFQVSQGQTLEIDEAAPEAPPELRAIVRRALATNPDERYATAGELAEEVQAFLTGGWVEAHRYSTREMLTRFVREHRSALLAAVVATGVVLAVLVGAWIQLLGERDRALDAERRARLGVAQALVSQARLARDERNHGAAEVLAAASLVESSNPAARALIAGLQYELRPELRWTDQTYAACTSLAASAAGQVACGTSEGVVVYDREGRRTHREPVGFAVAVARDEERNLWASLTTSGRVSHGPLGGPRLSRVVEGEPVGLGFVASRLLVATRPAHLLAGHPETDTWQTLDVERLTGGPAFATGGGRAVYVDVDGALRSLGSAAPLAELPSGREIRALATNGEVVAVATADHVVRWLSPSGWEALPRSVSARSLAFSRDRLYVGTDEGFVVGVALRAGVVVTKWRAHDRPVVALSAQGERVWSAGTDRRLRSFLLRSRKLPIGGLSVQASLRSARLDNFPMALDVDGRLIDWSTQRSLASNARVGDVGPDGHVWGSGRTVHVAIGRGPPGHHRLPAFVTAVRLAPSGRAFALGTAQGEVYLAELAAPSFARTTLTLEGEVRALAFRADGHLAASSDREVAVVDRDRKVVFRHASGAQRLEWFPSGPLLSLRGDAVILRNLNGREPRRVRLDGPGSALAISQGGRWAASYERRVDVFEGTRRLMTATLTSRVAGLGFRDDSLAVATEDGGVRAFELEALDLAPSKALSRASERAGLRRKGLELVPR